MKYVISINVKKELTEKDISEQVVCSAASSSSLTRDAWVPSFESPAGAMTKSSPFQTMKMLV